MSKYIFDKFTEENKSNYLSMEVDKAKVNRMINQFNIENVLCDDIVTNRSLNDKSIDITFVGLVFQYIAELDLALKNCHRILSDEGQLIFDVPNSMHYKNIWRYVIRRKSLLDTDCFNVVNFSIPIIYKILSRNKFKVKEVSFIKGLNDSIFTPKHMYEFIGIKATKIE